jgi:hypothetical protein
MAVEAAALVGKGDLAAVAVELCLHSISMVALAVLAQEVAAALRLELTMGAMVDMVVVVVV